MAAPERTGGSGKGAEHNTCTYARKTSQLRSLRTPRAAMRRKKRVVVACCALLGLAGVAKAKPLSDPIVKDSPDTTNNKFLARSAFRDEPGGV